MGQNLGKGLMIFRVRVRKGELPLCCLIVNQSHRLCQGLDLHRSSDAGVSFTKIANIQTANNLTFGKAAPGRQNPTVFINLY